MSQRWDVGERLHGAHPWLWHGGCAQATM